MHSNSSQVLHKFTTMFLGDEDDLNILADMFDNETTDNCNKMVTQKEKKSVDNNKGKYLVIV